MPRNTAPSVAESRARRRALGMRSTETVLHEAEIAVLDDIKTRLGLGSRSDAVRLLIAKMDPSTLTLADAAALTNSAG
jgi:hypothetical protein